MLPGFDKIIEDKIIKAQKKGLFNNLDGYGKPLPEENISINPELKIAYKILKNAGYLPPELELRKEIYNTEELLSELTDEKEIYKTEKKLNFLIKKYNIISNASIENELKERYFPKIQNQINKKS